MGKALSETEKKDLAKRGVKNYESMEMERAGGSNFEFSKETPIVCGKITKIVEREGDNGPYNVADLETSDGTMVSVASSAWTKNHFKVFKPGMVVRFEFKGKKGKAKVIEVAYAKGTLTEEMKKIIFTPNKNAKKKASSSKK